jgi:hypothetical protein
MPHRSNNDKKYLNTKQTFRIFVRNSLTMKHSKHSAYIPIVEGYGLDGPGLEFWQRQDTSLIHIVQTRMGPAQIPIQ